MARGPTSSWSDAPQAIHPSYSALPEVIEQHIGKEVARPDEKEVTEDLAYGLPTTENSYSNAQHLGGKASSSQSVSRRKKRLWIAVSVVALVFLGIALGLGLGLGLKAESSSVTPAKPTSTSESSQTPSPSFFSKRGAFNGTGIWAVQQQSLRNLTSGALMPSERNDGNFVMVFQHHTGQIRWMQRAYPDTWYGGTAYDVVAADAKNGTPIAFRGQDVFYVNKDNLLRQKHIDNVTYSWNDGPLNNLDVKVFDSTRIGLAACFYQGPIDNVDLNGTDSESGIRLWVATDETTFNQYAWRDGLPQWTQEQSWYNMNGHATPACFGWATGMTTYVMFVDEQNAIQLYWRDTSYKILSNATHPMNTWIRSSIPMPKVDPNTGLNYHGNLYGKPLNSERIHGWNITFDAEISGITSSSLSTVDGDLPMRNTQLYSFTTPAVGPARQGLVFYQTEGDDITLFTGDVATGDWSSVPIPIPDD